MGCLIFLGIVIVVAFLAKWGIVIFALIAYIFNLFFGKKEDCYPSSSSWCHFGYESFGCQPECPLYEHCWGSRDK